MMEVAIRTEVIRLGQLLKLAAVVESGSEAKSRVQGGEVLVNGEVETRRGRQLRPGDQVQIDQEQLLIIRDTET